MNDKLRTFLLACVPAGCVLLVTAGGIAVNSRGARVGAERGEKAARAEAVAPINAGPATEAVPVYKGKRYSREELDRQVTGKTLDEVVKLIGTPQQTLPETARHQGVWTYQKEVLDDATLRQNADIHNVAFPVRSGRVVGKSF